MTTFWGHSGVPPVIAPEGGLVLPRAKPSLTQCYVRVRVGKYKYFFIMFQAYFFIILGT